jgi:hypothetical protein
VFVEMLLAARRHKRLRSALAGMLAGARAAVGQLVRAGEPGADGQATAEVLLAAFDGLLLHRLLDSALGGPAFGGPAVAAPLRRLAGISEASPAKHSGTATSRQTRVSGCPPGSGGTWPP